MKKVITILYCLLCSMMINVFAQSANVEHILKQVGMENISVTQHNDTIIAAFETSTYRSNFVGIGAAIRPLIEVEENTTLQLIVLHNDLPQLCITLPASIIEQYQHGECDLASVYRTMDINTSTKNEMDKLKGTAVANKTFGKIDVIIYPGVLLLNNVTYKLYRAAFELNPAIEMQLWKGAMLRMQVCLPIINNEPGKWDCIRPGYLTLRQEYNIGNHWKGYITGGNFSDERQGVEAGGKYYTSNGRWLLAAHAGLTGASHLYGNDWRISKWKRITGEVSVGYYVPQLNTQLIMSGGRFVYGDYGVRGTLTRYFGEYLVGLYAMYTDGATNAGFHFSIPLPGKSRNRHKVRVMLPETFAFQYDMRSGNEYASRSLGVEYRTEPKSAENSAFMQPDYIRYFLIRNIDTQNKVKN